MARTKAGQERKRQREEAAAAIEDEARARKPSEKAAAAKEAADDERAQKRKRKEKVVEDKVIKKPSSTEKKQKRKRAATKDGGAVRKETKRQKKPSLTEEEKTLRKEKARVAKKAGNSDAEDQVQSEDSQDSKQQKSRKSFVEKLDEAEGDGAGTSSKRTRAASSSDAGKKQLAVVVQSPAQSPAEEFMELRVNNRWLMARIEQLENEKKHQVSPSKLLKYVHRGRSRKRNRKKGRSSKASKFGKYSPDDKRLFQHLTDVARLSMFGRELYSRMWPLDDSRLLCKASFKLLGVSKSDELLHKKAWDKWMQGTIAQKIRSARGKFSEHGRKTTALLFDKFRLYTEKEAATHTPEEVAQRVVTHQAAIQNFCEPMRTHPDFPGDPFGNPLFRLAAACAQKQLTLTSADPTLQKGRKVVAEDMKEMTVERVAFFIVSAQVALKNEKMDRSEGDTKALVADTQEAVEGWFAKLKALGASSKFVPAKLKTELPEPVVDLDESEKSESEDSGTDSESSSAASEKESGKSGTESESESGEETDSASE